MPEVRIFEWRLWVGDTSTRSCWQFHELGRGEFDFDGSTNPRRNLLAFLDLAVSRDLWVVLRPGP
jgi:beta-galactosidase